MFTVQENWGAGFELTYFDGTKFTKFDELVYLIFQAEQLEDGCLSLPIPTLLMSYEYVGEILFITVFELLQGQTQLKDGQLIATSEKFKITRFMVGPIDYSGEVNRRKFDDDTSFEVNKIGMGYIFETKKGFIVPASFYSGEAMQITYTPLKEIKIVMDRKLNDDVVNAVYTRIQNQ